MLEVASFVISIFALLISTYAIYQVYKSNNMKLSVNDISKRVFNRFDPVFIRFTINNHSSKSITIKTISFEDDEGNPIQTHIDFEPKSMGYEPPKPKPRTVVMGIDITPPSFEFPLPASPSMYENILENNEVIHSNSSIDCAYYIKGNPKSIVIVIELDQRMNGFKKKLTFNLQLGPLYQDY